MDYSVLLDKYDAAPSEAAIAELVARARQAAATNMTVEVFRRCYGALDVTTLSETDTPFSIVALVNELLARAAEYPDLPPVASICVFPPFVDIAAMAVEGTGIGVTSVAGGFPAAQTFLEVKMLEVAMAVESGADEVDVVMNPGEIVAGEWNRAANDIELLRGEAEEVTLKVIIESGALREVETIRHAALLAMHAGADFVKTSTGKIAAGATPEAVATMCLAIRDYHRNTGNRVGIKVAGGVRTVADAVLYYTIVEAILGDEWLTPALFRIGASSLAKELAVVAQRR